MSPKLRFLILTIFGGALFSSGCQSGGADGGGAEIQVDSTTIQRHIRTLASDEFMGRKPFTEGENKTINYLRDEFQKLGIAPGNGDSYFQEAPLVEIQGMPDSSMQVSGPDAAFDLQLGKDFVTYTEREQETITLDASELVFCGYGIVAPEYNWNDYEGIDMTGKTAVVMVNDPGFQSGDSTLFKGNTMTYYGRWTYKYEEAARQGADGILIIHETAAAGYPWFVVSSSWSGAKLNLQTPDGNMGRAAIQGWVTLNTASRIFKASGMTDARFFEQAKSPDFEPIPLGVTVSHSLRNSFKKDVSQNVVGMIEGSERPEEVIIYSAHWDHLGVAQPVAGDSIYNGAVDNATGTASALAIAEAFSKLPRKPERSIVFLLVTAEEQGLLGSAHYAENPIFDPNNTVANLNMDALNAYGRTKDLIVIGYGQSELDDYAESVVQEQGRYIVPDQEPEKGFYFRSDHFSFAKIGIPALYAESGIDHISKGKAYGRRQKEAYTANDYHRPSDEYDPETWVMSGLQQDAQFFFEVARRLAGEETFPQWKAGSEFQGIRERDR